ncbi:MAG: energy transducer TonB [candidate division WOR-3 bacterium]
MTTRTIVRDNGTKYGRDIRLAFILSLGIVLATFLLVKQIEVKPYALSHTVDPEVIYFGPRVEPPPRPPDDPKPQPKVAIPIASDNPADTGKTVGKTDWPDIRVTDPPQLEPVPFWKVEKPPVLVETAHAVYPELARQAGIEGRVTVQVVVGADGRPGNPTVIGTSGSAVLDQAAVEAALRCRFVPGYQRDKPVPVLVAIPFRFRLGE